MLISMGRKVMLSRYHCYFSLCLFIIMPILILKNIRKMTVMTDDR